MAKRTHNKPDELLTTREAAELLGYSPGTLKNWRSEGVVGLPFVRPRRGGKIAYRRSDIEAFLAKNTKTHT